MSTLGLVGFTGYIPPGSAIVTAINNIRALNQYASNYQSGGIWRPPQWNINQPSTWNITVPVTSQQVTADQQVNAATGGVPLNPIVYVFDAILRSDQDEAIRRTEHPVQTGANISDNAYLMPARVVLEIGMSDAMDTFYPGQFSSNQSKSVSAFTTLLALKNARQFVTVTTRLKTYQNMLVEDVGTSDSKETKYALRARVTFSQVFTASVESVGSTISFATDGSNTASARPDSTGYNPLGTVAGTTPSTTVVAQHMVTASDLPQPFPTVPGAGNYSSGNVSSLTQILG